MTPTQAHQLALELMRRHGLLAAGWRFRFSSGKQQLGSCRIRQQVNRITGEKREVKTISLSRNLIALNSDDEVRDTLLHEIAHARVGVKHGHDAVWKAECRRIGAKPERLAGEEVRVVEPRYVVLCGVCRAVMMRRHRRPAPELLSRYYCRHCGPRSKGTLFIGG